MARSLLRVILYYLSAMAVGVWGRVSVDKAERMSVAVEIAKPIVKKWEGCKLTAYRCPAGVWTIGYGHTGPNVVPGLRIPQEQADALLAKDLDTAEKIVNTLVEVAINRNQRAALISFVFNFGSRAFAASTLRKYVNERRFDLAADEFLKWVNATDPKSGEKRPLAGLISRRAEERALFMAPPS